MGPVGFEPTTNQLCTPPQLSLPLSGLWAGLSLHPLAGCLPSSLYTFTAIRRRLARDYRFHAEVGFPEFDRILYRVSPVEALCGVPYPAHIRT